MTMRRYDAVGICERAHAQSLNRSHRSNGLHAVHGLDGADSLGGIPSAFSPGEVLRPLAFATCYVYSPRGGGAIAAGSRVLRTRLKSGDPAWLARYAARVWKLTAGSGHYDGVFGPDVALVPAPRSRATAPQAVWVAERLAMHS